MNSIQLWANCWPAAVFGSYRTVQSLRQTTRHTQRRSTLMMATAFGWPILLQHPVTMNALSDAIAQS
jgi:hypothetical protein